MGAVRLLLSCALIGGCVVEDVPVDAIESESTSCDAAGTFSPYGGGAHPTGTVAAYPWPGEAFETYPSMPISVECAYTKDRRRHVEVTAGCLDAVEVGGKYARGRIRTTSGGAFRALALGHDGSDPAAVKWTDQAVDYRFHYAAASGTANMPGFKAFVRYRSEDDLYVASWRTDGVVQIQKKQCGRYTALAVIDDFGAPSPGVWHRMRFEAIGDQLELHLDGDLVLAADSSTFAWGTAGVRVDSMNGAYLDDWRVD